MHLNHTQQSDDTQPPGDSPQTDHRMRFDDTGKVSLDHIYGQPDPHAYFSTLRKLDYVIPQLAKPHFTKLVQEFWSRWGRTPTILDVGCSYGVNAALLRCDASMGELYERYCDAGPHPGREGFLDRDREFVRSRASSRRARFVGLDASRPALAYALAAGFLDDTVHANLEDRDPTESEREKLAGTDIVVSTGCLGYVTERTVTRLAVAAGEHRPWMAHFVLRMFPFAPIAQSLAGLGYETVGVGRVFRQRRFASAEEQSLVLDTLSTVGVDPRGLESDGWLYAQLYLSRPRGASSRAAAAVALGQKPAVPVS